MHFLRSQVSSSQVGFTANSRSSIGEFEAKEDNLKMYRFKTKEVVNNLQDFHILHVPRSENQQVDALSRMVSSADGLSQRTIMWQVIHQPGINAKQTFVLDRTSTWMDKMIKYLRDEELPSDEKEAEKVQAKAKWFAWHDENLYKKSYTHPLLKFVTPEDGDYILREIYEGACGSHQGSKNHHRQGTPGRVLLADIKRRCNGIGSKVS